MRCKRSISGSTATNVQAATEVTPVTDYKGKVEDPHSNCCDNDYSREEFRAGVRQVKMKKFKHHFDAIKPPTPKKNTSQTITKTKEETTGKIQRDGKFIQLVRKRRNVKHRSIEDLYPSKASSGESHQLGRFGISEEDHTVTLASSTRWPTTPKFLTIPGNRTKSKLIKGEFL